MTKLQGFWGVIFWFGANALSWAAHPFLTDDSGTQGAGNWQLETMAERSRHSSSASSVRQDRRATELMGVLTYGLDEALDVALGLGRLRQKVLENGAPLSSISGAGDTSLELKWRFHDADQFSLGLKWGLVLPTGDENRGLGSGKLSSNLNFIMHREVKPWSLMANLAYSRERYRLADDEQANRGDLWRASVGLAYQLCDELRLLAEAGVRTNSARADVFMPGSHGKFAMLGLIYSPTAKTDFDLGLRKGLNNAELATTLLAGMTFRW